MEDKLRSIIARYKEVEESLNDPTLASDMKKFTQTNREYKQLQPLVEASTAFLNLVEDMQNNKELMADKSEDPEIREMAKEEYQEQVIEVEKQDEALRVMLIPKDPNDMKNCIMEIRAGAGGDEAGIFAGDLFRMYKLYCEKNGYKLQVLSFNEINVGGFKEIVFQVEGNDAYGHFKFESGVHRVQRVPETESQGRVHTSAASVVVLPEVEDIDFELNMNDLRIDIYHAGGHGGQNVNKVATAVRIVHLPSNIMVACQEERSQLRNKEKAMTLLRSKLYEIELEKQQSETADARKSMVKTGDRSDKIRTYNFPQNRVTDHRLEGDAKNYSLQEIIEGKIETLMENLKIAENAEALKQGVS